MNSDIQIYDFLHCLAAIHPFVVKKLNFFFRPVQNVPQATANFSKKSKVPDHMVLSPHYTIAADD